MMHLFLNGLAASSGAGLTYFRNVIPQLGERNDIRVTVALGSLLRGEFENRRNISFLEVDVPGAARRFWLEQTVLPRLIRNSGADVLISTGNFALRRSPVPQILLSGNSLYTSANFFRDLRQRHDYRLWLDTRIKAFFAKRSVSWADCTVAPSEAFAQDLRQWTGCARITGIHHGFDHERFIRRAEPLSDEVGRKVGEANGALRLLFVSHYNYYRNFETLLQALPLLRPRLNGRKLRLFLTCKLSAGSNPGTFHTAKASGSVRQLGIADEVVELGTVPYRSLHNLYRGCDMYVTPAYAETFAHPLVEAMASGIPVVASDLAVHREICDGAAVYFERFSPQDLAQQVLRVVHSAELSKELSQRGLSRSRDFSWREHVEHLVSLARSLANSAGSTSVPGL